MSSVVRRLAAHTKALSAYPGYPVRFAIEDSSLIPWSTPYPEYKPVEFTEASLLEHAKPAFQDAPDVADVDLSTRLTYENGGKLRIDEASGRPLNPCGRTGMSGRGTLWRWGPNHAADPIVTRVRKGLLEFVAIQRRDNKRWAIPGGMVDPGEAVSATLRREFTEEAGNVAPDKRELFTSLLDKLFASGGVEVYRGYVDDPRNTDNAWMETSAFNFHCPPELAEMLTLEAGDDAQNVKWMPVDEDDADFQNLFASHKQFVLQAASLHA